MENDVDRSLSLKTGDCQAHRHFLQWHSGPGSEDLDGKHDGHDAQQPSKFRCPLKLHR